MNKIFKLAIISIGLIFCFTTKVYAEKTSEATTEVTTEVTTETTTEVITEEAATENPSNKKETDIKKKKPKIKKVKNYADGSKLVTWTKMDCDGYQVKFSINKHFKKEYKPTTKKLDGNDNNMISCINLKKDRTYYIKIRAYIKDTDTGKTIYSKWSKIKKFKK